MKLWRVYKLRSVEYEIEAETQDEAIDLALGDEQEAYEVGSETFGVQVEEAEELPA